jgi:hypothetical protein
VVGRPPAGLAAHVTRYVDTVDIAGIAFRVSCRFPKPGFWARRHPQFLTDRAPDVRVRIEYDDALRRRAGGDTVADAPCVRRRGRALVASTGYYHALVDVARGHAAVRMAGGFDVAACMRTLAALWLLERDTLLLRGRCFGPRGAATLACGFSSGAGRALAPLACLEGWLAVTPRADGVAARVTPFLVEEGPVRGARGWRVSALWVPGDAEGDRPVGSGRALRALLPSVWQADRRRAAVERTLDLAARIAMSLQCREIGAAAPAPAEAIGG